MAGSVLRRIVTRIHSAMFSATVGTMPAGVRRSGCPEHGDPWGRKDLNLRSRETPGLQPGPFGRLGNTPVGGPTRRRLGGSSSSPARWAGAMRPAPRPGGRSGVRSPIEHGKVALGGAGGRIPVLGRFAIEFSKTMHTRLLLAEASVRCGSPSGRCSRFAVQARRPAVEPEGRDRPVGTDRWDGEKVDGQAVGLWNWDHG